MHFFSKLFLGLRLISGIPFVYRNWPIVFLDYLFLIKSKIVCYALRSGPAFYARPRTYDIYIANEVFILHEYERKQYDITIRPNDTILDVGAFIGDFTIYAAHKAPQGFVYAVEPDSENSSLLQKNIAINAYTNVFLHPCGIGGSDEIRVLHRHSASYGASSLFSPLQHYRRKLKILPSSEQKNIDIQLYTVETFLQDNRIKQVDYVKLDCEGMEYEILLSIPDTILRSIRCFVVEFHALFDISKLREKKEKILEKFRMNNFTIYQESKDSAQSLVMLYCRNRDKA